MTKITESGGTQDIMSTEPPAHINTIFIDYSKDAEKVNVWWAMIGLVAFFSVFTSIGQIIPGFLGNFLIYLN